MPRRIEKSLLSETAYRVRGGNCGGWAGGWVRRVAAERFIAYAYPYR